LAGSLHALEGGCPEHPYPPEHEPAPVAAG
jgi:hypothetical protein